MPSKVDRFGQRVIRPRWWQLGRLWRYWRNKVNRWRDGEGYNYDD